MDPILEEILRVHTPDDIQFHSLRRWQAHIRDVIGPKLDGLEAVEAASADDEAATPEKRKR